MNVVLIQAGPSTDLIGFVLQRRSEISCCHYAAYLCTKLSSRLRCLNILHFTVIYLTLLSRVTNEVACKVQLIAQE